MFLVEFWGPVASHSGLLASLFEHCFFDPFFERLNVIKTSRIGRGTAAVLVARSFPISPPSDSLPSLAPAGSGSGKTSSFWTSQSFPEYLY